MIKFKKNYSSNIRLSNLTLILQAYPITANSMSSQFNSRVPAEDEARPKIGFLYSVFLLAGIVAGGMGFVRWQSSHLMGLIDFVFAGLNFALLFYLSRHKQYVEIVSTLAITFSFILFVAIYLLAPYNTMRLSLFFLLAASGFFLKGRQAGRLWLVGILVVILSVHVSGYFATGYSNLDITTTCIYLIALMLIFENYETFKEKERQRKRSEEEAVRAKEAAEAANLTKSQFLATMSHELRTPMNGILGMAQLLMMPELTEADRQEFTRTILNSGQTLLSLLDDILDISKIEAGKIELTYTVCNPRHIIEETTALFASSAHAKDMEIVADWHGQTAQHYLLDSIRLRQILSNLISNAIKFTPHGFVRVEGVEIERRGNEALLEFSVTDSGIGIPADKRSLLFKPFSQLDSSTTREYGGTGLGLSIVRSLAQLMGGDVFFESEPGKGSRFWFRIRADIVQEGEENFLIGLDTGFGPDTTPSSGLVGLVLVVDDSLTNRKLTEACLKKFGLQVESVENGLEAVNAITKGMRPDLVLMDIQMPVMDGFNATERIRQWEKENRQPRLPIIALTATVFGDDRQQCIASGMDDFLSKPFTINDLKSILAKWTGRKDLEGKKDV